MTDKARFERLERIMRRMSPFQQSGSQWECIDCGTAVDQAHQPVCLWAERKEEELAAPFEPPGHVERKKASGE